MEYKTINYEKFENDSSYFLVTNSQDVNFILESESIEFEANCLFCKLDESLTDIIQIIGSISSVPDSKSLYYILK